MRYAKYFAHGVLAFALSTVAPAQAQNADEIEAAFTDHLLTVSEYRDPHAPSDFLMQVEFRLGKHDAAQATLDAELVELRPNQAGLTTVWGLRTIGADLGTRTRVRGFVRQALAS